MTTREKQPTLRQGNTVLKRTETDPEHTGTITRICDEPGYVMVRWPGDKYSKVHRSQLVLQADWQALRDQQAALKNYWQVGEAQG